MSNLAIIGCGGHGRVAADIAKKLNYKKIVFLDKSWNENVENNTKKTEKFWPIIGNYNLSTIDKLVDENYKIFIAITKNSDREKVFKMISEVNLVSLIDPSAVISEKANISLGTIVCGNSVVNIGSRIGYCSIINTGAIIDHDCMIDNFVHISPGVSLAGSVYIGKRSWMGIGSTVIGNIHIGSDVMVAAGAVVVKAVDNSKIVYGIPAKEKYEN